jgi:predicted transcriptional regulator
MSFNFKIHLPGGPHPNFSMYHVWKCYDTIGRKGPVGRRALTTIVGIGEGSIRTMLRWMEKEGCIENTSRGAILTDKGKEAMAGANISIISIDYVDLNIGKFNCSALVRKASDRVTYGCEQRDEVVRCGAGNAITLVAVEGGIFFPGDHNFPDPEKMSPVKLLNKVNDGDVIIIAGANSYQLAERGAISAALSLRSSSFDEQNEGTRMLSRDYEDEDVKTIALAIHELVGRLPVTMRTKNHFGVRCEGGKIIETNFTGPVLEETLRHGKITRQTAKAGKYRGVPVLAVPFIRNNECIAVVGVFDTTRGSYYQWLGKVSE